MSERGVSRWLSSLESEAIEIIREGIAGAARPVMLYSMGKDSSVLLHLARKAFWPAPPPLPLLHIDTTWQFREMIAFRDRVVAEAGVELVVHVNQEGLKAGVDPFSHGSERYTDVMTTEALRQALGTGKYDIVFVGRAAGRGEVTGEGAGVLVPQRGPPVGPQGAASRTLEPLQHPRPPGANRSACLRFPTGTEADIWRYIAAEGIPVVPLYFAKKRPVVERNGQWIMVDDERMPLGAREEPQRLRIRFRTLGCYPLTAAVESDADTLEAILAETLATHDSERRGRLVDHDGDASMERKKREGYF